MADGYRPPPPPYSSSPPPSRSPPPYSPTRVSTVSPTPGLQAPPIHSSSPSMLTMFWSWILDHLTAAPPCLFRGGVIRANPAPTPLPSFNHFSQVPATTIRTLIREWGRLSQPSTNPEELRVVSLTHAKRRILGFQHEFVLMQVWNTQTQQTLHLVAERAMDMTTSRACWTLGRAVDTLLILSEADQGLYTNAIQISYMDWEDGRRPPLRDVIKLLCLISSLHSDYHAFSFSCYYFAAVTSTVVRRYRTPHGCSTLVQPWKGSKASRFFLAQVVGSDSIWEDAIEVIVTFYQDILETRDAHCGL